ncbi:MAG: lysine biosynthesis protein LysX [archaeon]
MKIGLLLSKIRPEEKMLTDDMKKKGIDYENIIDEEHVFDLSKNKFEIDAVLERSLSFSKGLYISKIFEGFDVPVINKSRVAEICGDKFLTTQALLKNNVSTPKVMMAFSEKSALAAVEEMGYPAVLKPVTGSWARLISKVNDKESAESIIEHKSVLGHYMHSIFYVQEYVQKPGRDIRAFFVGDETIAAIYRNSEHWITNTARGGVASNCIVSDEINELCIKAAKAVGGGVLAMDLFESKDGLTVNEINHTMEFKNSVAPTRIDIPGKIIDYVIGEARR